jgi:hypothetical protein
MFIKKSKYTGEPKYKCDMCRKTLDYRPTRVSVNTYNTKKQVYSVDFNIDLCYNCYNIFNKWVKKGWRYHDK